MSSSDINERARKRKTRKPGTIQFRPPCEGVNGSNFRVKDEVIALGVNVHIERMSEECIFMSIQDAEGRGYAFNFSVGNHKVDDGDGEMVYPIWLTATERYER